MQLRTRSNAFDTDSALKVFSRDNGLPPKQVDFRRETLYRTRGGALFLHIEGGADQSIIHKGPLVKEKIEPIGLLEASDWLRSRGASGVVRGLTNPKETNRLCLKIPQKDNAEIECGEGAYQQNLFADHRRTPSKTRLGGTKL